ncbi:MAG: Colicin I receptor precursor [Bacteroidetes bacterium ADurb.Bin174]|nr:MAG: Colicin I receptor precursor [Bacteroidetes bacterium ADurb.Bin174]
MKKIIIATLLVFSTLANLFAEVPAEFASHGALTGRVVDEMGYVLPGATIKIEGTNFGTISDIDGFFRLTGLENGTYLVRVNYVGYNPVEQTVTVVNNRTVPLNNIVLKEGLLIEEVVVTALNAQHRAMSRQKNNINVTNVISADQVARFPDSNIGDALKRIPGISVQYDQGEARFGHIRGTSPDLSSVTIDGTRVPSAEADIRSVQLDLIPSDMIQTIEVNKVIMPEMDADAIGGTVNLVTKSQPVGRRITAMGGSGYNLISEKPMINLGLSYGDRFIKDRLGMVAAISFQDNPLGSDNAEFTWDKTDDGKLYVEDYQVRQYFVHRQRQSYSLALDYVINPDHKIEFNGMYNKRYDWENRYRMRIRNISPQDDGSYEGRMERQVKFGTKDTKYARLEDQQVMTFSLGGNHNISKLMMDWKTNYSKASERRPNERYINYRTKYFTFNNDLSNPRKPMASGFKKDGNDFDINDYNNFGLNEITESLQYTYDEDLSGKLDFSLPFNPTDTWKNGLAFGASFKFKTKRNDVEYYEYEPVDTYEDEFDALVADNLIDQTRSNFLAGNYAAGKFPDRKVFGDLQFDGNDNFEKSRILEEDLANFDAKERVIGSYLRYDQRLIDKVDLVLGMRMEHTSLAYNAFQWDEDEDAINPVKGDPSSYINLLPSVIAKWDVNDDFKIKAAWTNTLARPKYTDLTPRQSISFENERIEIGNPKLVPTKSMNFDLMMEYYVNGGLFSAGVFYKDIQNFIVESRYDNYEYMNRTWKEFRQPINGGNADLLGFEVAMQQNLSFLPGFLRYFNVYTNYTYNHSAVKDFNYEGRENEKLSLPGTPTHTLNAALGFNSRKFSARLSYNFASDFIDELGESAYQDVYYDKVNYLDFNANLSIGKYVNIFANVNNILNQPLRYYQGSQEYTYQVEYYNFRFDAGVKLNF